MPAQKSYRVRVHDDDAARDAEAARRGIVIANGKFVSRLRSKDSEALLESQESIMNLEAFPRASVPPKETAFRVLAD